MFGFLDGKRLAMPYPFPVAEDILKSDGTPLILELAVYVDNEMATRLQSEHGSASSQVNAVLSAFNAVQVIYDDDSFGDQKVRIFVKRVIIDQSGKKFKGEPSNILSSEMKGHNFGQIRKSHFCSKILVNWLISSKAGVKVKLPFG